jgi:hypothetical protein
VRARRKRHAVRVRLGLGSGNGERRDEPPCVGLDPVTQGGKELVDLAPVAAAASDRKALDAKLLDVLQSTVPRSSSPAVGRLPQGEEPMYPP